MRWWFLITVFFLNSQVFSQEDQRFYFFQRNEHELAECIEEHTRFYMAYHSEELELDDIFTELGRRISALYSEVKSDTREGINEELATSINRMKDDGEYNQRHGTPWGEILIAVINAMVNHCNDDVSIPHFDGEPKDLADILNYVLVDWYALPDGVNVIIGWDSLYDMARTQEGRFILSEYANNAQEMLRSAFSEYGHENFRVILSILWRRRAQQYFDHRRGEFPYIPYYFIEGQIRTYMDSYDELTDILCNPMSTEKKGHCADWCERNPGVLQEKLNKILNIHIADRSSYNLECDIFNVYGINGMDTVEEYFERHMDQFYRALFFIQELRARDLLPNENSIYGGSFPVEVLPEEITEMLRNDTVYRDYLLRLRLIYQNNSGNSARRNLMSSSRVCVEDLFEVMIAENLTSHIYDTFSTTTSKPTTTTTPVTSTTNATPDNKRKKGSVYENYCGKKFLKRPRLTTDSCCDCEFDKPGPSGMNKHTDSCYKQRHNHNVTISKNLVFSACSITCNEQLPEKPFYGFILSNNNSVVDSTTYMSIVAGFLAELAKVRYQNHFRLKYILN